MPGMNVVASCHETWEMECERYFYDELETEEDFFKSTAPSENIWKKFELLPTPPMSPSRTPNGDTLFPLSGDQLGVPPKVAAQDEDYEGWHKIDPLDVFGNLSSIVIKDCMWSGLSACQRLEINERSLVSSHSRLSTHLESSVNSKSLRASPDTPVTRTPATEYVDPTAVLNLPITHPKRPAKVSSGLDSLSDSSDDDDTNTDEDEIDVVSVDNLPKRGCPTRQRTPVTIVVSADPHGPCPKRFHISLHRQQHNYAAPSPDSEPEEESEEEEEPESRPASKRARLEESSSTTAFSSPSYPSPPSFSSSDSEDPTERRRNHNFLERKRRNDLRSRFLALRDEIPGLSDSAKTPKVTILTRATEYLVQLHAHQRHQLQERKKLRAKQQQLLKKLNNLKSS
ncbi:protein L-Myc-1a [Chanos chanos]|uniref:Protein L-Myc-1a n=1 Tax=Chanos chanos TaxID=29144 RepID=A0A6J2VAB3_CHACN|nr:protein L-Myc-1a-like [Chanos chanos]